MNPNDNKNYNPAEDDNQGVIQPLAQATNGGFSQTGGLAIPTAQGPEPEKAEVNEEEADTEDINDDTLTEEDVQEGKADSANK